MQPSPPSLTDEVFGCLQWDDSIGFYSGKAEFHPGRWVDIRISPDGGTSLSQSIKESGRRFSELKLKFPKIYPVVRDEYLTLYNKSWCDVLNGFGQRVGQGRISADKFDEYLFVETIYFERDGGIELWFHDNDRMFYGHMIRVSLNAALEITSTGLEG